MSRTGRSGAWAGPVLVVLFLCAVLAVLRERLVEDGWDPTVLVTAGDAFADRARLTAPIRILPHSTGYDGQFFYRIALDPAVTRAWAFGLKLDDRADRLSRIGYPVLVWAASLGRTRLVPWMLIGVNLALLAGIAATGVSLARRRGLPALCGLVLPAYPGLLLSLMRDTAEIAASCFGVLALAMVLRGRAWAAGCFGVAAVLTRESTLLYLAGFGLVELARALRRRAWSPALPALLAPLAALAVWHWALFRITGGGSVLASTGGHDLGVPLRGILRFAGANLDALARARGDRAVFDFQRYRLLAALFCVATLLLPAFAAAAAPAGLALSWLLYAGLAAVMTDAVWDDPWGYLRILSDGAMVGGAVLLASGRRAPLALQLCLTAAMWALTAGFVLL